MRVMIMSLFKCTALILFLPSCLFATAVSAQAQLKKDGDLDIRKISESVYLHTSYKKLEPYGLVPSNGLVLLKKGDAYIVDTPWPDKASEELLAWIKAKGYRAKASLSTHSHDDRSAGIARFNAAGVSTLASVQTNTLLAAEQKPLAKLSFSGDRHTWLAGELEIFYPGKAHAPDNVVVWLPESKILFGGCAVRELSSSTMGNTADADLNQWAGTITKLIDHYPKAAIVVPGHGDLGGVELLHHTIDLLVEHKKK